ncbi:hypothetical protein BU26DRAFT_499003 [Trematosphaeria pertusa]|uniref:Uncharacterized protein n=1 Tax=Trematosphaeria pertusa TaxID=390896 RepID=A0A6A6J1U4_9PLEO|nr:uncharacterized protein BU26DRAFT_499003 [Trematosphaeria pertusa]KAF2256317.1 hypothetical protein BU26DRAFT_499003 [Trematosphaeria pertusa]
MEPWPGGSRHRAPATSAVAASASPAVPLRRRLDCPCCRRRATAHLVAHAAARRRHRSAPERWCHCRPLHARVQGRRRSNLPICAVVRPRPLSGQAAKITPWRLARPVPPYCARLTSVLPLRAHDSPWAAASVPLRPPALPSLGRKRPSRRRPDAKPPYHPGDLL